MANCHHYMEHHHHLKKYQESFCLIIFLKKGLFEWACFGGCSSKISPPDSKMPSHIISLTERFTTILVKILVYERKIAVESEIQAVWDGRGEIVELRAVQKSPNPQLHHNVLTPIWQVTAQCIVLHFFDFSPLCVFKCVFKSPIVPSVLTPIWQVQFWG